MKLSNSAENFAKANGVKVPVIDGYRNARMTEKLGLTDKLPAVVTLKKGVVDKVAPISAESDIASALA